MERDRLLHIGDYGVIPAPSRASEEVARTTITTPRNDGCRPGKLWLDVITRYRLFGRPRPALLCGLVARCPGGWETAGVVLVVDDLVGWLVGRLADAGYQKVSRRLWGSEQDRALKEAVTVAVQATADEISPSDKEQA